MGARTQVRRKAYRKPAVASLVVECQTDGGGAQHAILLSCAGNLNPNGSWAQEGLLFTKNLQEHGFFRGNLGGKLQLATVQNTPGITGYVVLAT